MIRQYNTLSTGTEQVLGYSGTGKHLQFAGFTLVLLTFAAGAYCAEEGTRVDDHDDAVVALEHAQTTNIMCPVMTDMKVDPRTNSSLIFWDGKYESSWKKDFENVCEIRDQAGHATRVGAGAGGWLLVGSAGRLV